MENRELRESFKERFGKAYYPDTWELDSQLIGITFESLYSECHEAWEDEDTIRKAFKDADYFTRFVIDRLDWQHPTTLIKEIIFDLYEEEENVMDDINNEDDGDEIEAAKRVLRAAGFFVDNLWSLPDVKDRYVTQSGEDISDDEAYSILDDVLTYDLVVEKIFEYIDSTATEKYSFKERSDD